MVLIVILEVTVVWLDETLLKLELVLDEQVSAVHGACGCQLLTLHTILKTEDSLGNSNAQGLPPVPVR